MGIYLYDDMGIPTDFKFPEGLIHILKSDPVPYPEPWFYVQKFPDYAKDIIKIVRDLYNERSLIPFASLEINDDFACFDGNDHSGDPKVHIVHFFASPGWEDRGSFENFEAWLQAAKADSEEYKRLMEEEAN